MQTHIEDEKMKGTEKQIEWANSIKQEIIDGLNKLQSDADSRVSDKSMPVLWSTVTKNGVEKAMSMINKIETASKMIEIRKANIVDRVSSLIVKDYNNVK